MGRRTRWGAGLLSTMLGVGLVPALASAGHADATYATTTSIHGIKKHGTPYTQTVISKVTPVGAPDTAYLGGDAVLLRHLKGTKGWRSLGKGTWDSQYQRFYWQTNKQGNATFQVHYLGGTDGFDSTVTYQPSDSATVRVRQHRFDVASQKVHGLRVFVMHGHLLYYPHRRVTLQERGCRHCRWRTIGHPRTDQHGSYAVRVRGSRQGIYHRVIAPKTPQFLRTVSKVWVALIL